MRKNRKVLTGSALLLCALAWACQDRPEGWTPVLEENSTAFLESETGRVLERVRAAREAMTVDPAEAEANLQEAESSLEHLIAYYLPLLQAREQAYNAYRSLLRLDERQALQDLAKIEHLLEGMAESASGGRLHELQSLGEELADARLAVESGSEEGRSALEALARALNEAVVKGDLILRN